jgi:CheY-like chemotaxis protein
MARILLADDDAAQLSVQASLLETLGHQVDIAFSPSEALRQLARSMPGLIVMDLRFPTAAEGLALIRAIRAAGYLRPVIVLSGWPDDLYGAPEEPMVSRVVVKGSARALLEAIAGLLAG